VKEKFEKATAQRAAHKQQVPKRVHERGYRRRHERKRQSMEELAKALSAAVNKAQLEGAFIRESSTDHTPVDHADVGVPFNVSASAVHLRLCSTLQRNIVSLCDVLFMDIWILAWWFDCNRTPPLHLYGCIQHTSPGKCPSVAAVTFSNLAELFSNMSSSIQFAFFVKLICPVQFGKHWNC